MKRLATLAIGMAAAALTVAGQVSSPSFTITTQSLPPAVIGQPYTPLLQQGVPEGFVLTTSGDPGPMVWSFAPGSGGPPNFAVGPAGFGQQSTTGTFCFVNSSSPSVCSQNNVLSTPGLYSVTIQARSLTSGLTASQQYSFWIVNPLQITTTSLPDGTAGQAYSVPIQTNPNGGTGQFTWSIINGNLPPGIGLGSSTGVLAGTVPGVNNVYTFTIQVLDQVTQFTASQTFTLAVVGGLAITSTTLPDAVLNHPYSFQFQGTGGANLVWSVQPGWPLPPGFALSPSGLLTSPTGPGNSLGKFQLEIQLTNPQLELTTPPNLYPFTLYVTLGPLGINQAALQPTIQNLPYVAQLTGSGGIPPYAWSFATPNPQGLSIGVNTGTVSGTLTNAGTFSIPVVLTDSVGRVYTQTYSLTVGAAVSITKTAFANGPAGVPYSDSLTASGGAFPYRWDLVSGSLPPGLTLTTINNNGIISGIPTTEGTFPFTARVTDFVGGVATRLFTITIGPVLTITTTSLPDGVVGSAYSQTLTNINGTAPFTWSIDSGALPPGIQLNSATGVISGTPTSAGNFTFDVQVNDALQAVAHRTLSIKIPLLISPNALSGIVLAAFSQTLTATGGQPPYIWFSGPLPAGLQLNSATGVISGTPGTAGSSPVVFTATDVNGLTGTKTVTINILLPPAPATTIGVGTTTQPVVTISTGAPYPLEITGFLTLTFASSVGSTDGGEARFSDGTRQLFFVVRPNTTQGLFTTVSNGTPAIMTGTVAGTITLTVSMSASGQDITPSPAPTQTITIKPAVPVITSVTLQQVTGGLSVVVSGYSNTREVSSGSFTFTVSSGNTLSQATIPVSLASAYTTWFSNSASNATGGQFKLTVPFSVTQGAATAVTKVSVTLTNGQGPSLPVSSQ